MKPSFTLYNSHIRKVIGDLAILSALALVFAVAPVQAQTSPNTLDSPTSDPQKEVAVTPDVRDSEIADRLRRILVASEWFSSLAVSVREGIVFIDGQADGTDLSNAGENLLVPEEKKGSTRS